VAAVPESLGAAPYAMKRLRSVLLIALGLIVGLPVGWCLRGRSVAATEALRHNLAAGGGCCPDAIATRFEYAVRSAIGHW